MSNVLDTYFIPPSLIVPSLSSRFLPVRLCCIPTNGNIATPYGSRTTRCPRQSVRTSQSHGNKVKRRTPFASISQTTPETKQKQNNKRDKHCDFVVTSHMTSR